MAENGQEFKTCAKDNEKRTEKNKHPTSDTVTSSKWGKTGQKLDKCEKRQIIGDKIKNTPIRLMRPRAWVEKNELARSSECSIKNHVKEPPITLDYHKFRID